MASMRALKLVRLPSEIKSYRNLTVQVMDKGSGKTTWAKHGCSLAQEIALLIDSKPDKEWLVVYHKAISGGGIPDLTRGLLSTTPHCVSFLNWGRHQGVNKFRHVQNVILAGVNNYSEVDYEVMARCHSRIRNDEKVIKTSVQAMETGEHMHHILQALCRSAVRKAVPPSAVLATPTSSPRSGLVFVASFPWSSPVARSALGRLPRRKPQGR